MNTYIAVVDWNNDRDDCPAVLTAPTLELLHQHTARLIHGIENNTHEYDRFIFDNPLNSDDPVEAKAWLDELHASCFAPVVTVHVVDQAAISEVQEAATIDATGGTATPIRSRFYVPSAPALAPEISDATTPEVEMDAEERQAIQDCEATGHHECGQREVSCWHPPVTARPQPAPPADLPSTEEGPRMSNAPRDLDQALPIALADFRAYIADGVIPTDGSVQGWGDLADYTDHNLTAIEAIFPDDKDGTAWTRADFDPRIDELAIAIEAAIASGDLDVGLTDEARAAITECIANQHRACDGVNPCWTPPAPTTPQTITAA